MKFLVHFLDDWLDFRYAELVSLLELLQLQPGCVIKPSDNYGIYDYSIEKQHYDDDDDRGWRDFLTDLRQNVNKSSKVEHFMVS